MKTKTTFKREKTPVETAKNSTRESNMNLLEMTDHHIAEILQKEYDRIMGEPDFSAVKTFRLYYPGYSVRKYK